jgi:hypothetical protein
MLTRFFRLFTKGSRIIELEKLREIVGDYQQLNYAKGGSVPSSLVLSPLMKDVRCHFITPNLRPGV